MPGGEQWLGGKPCQGPAAEGGGRRPVFTGLATQPYSATEVDGWATATCFLRHLYADSRRRYHPDSKGSATPLIDDGAALRCTDGRLERFPIRLTMKSHGP